MPIEPDYEEPVLLIGPPKGRFLEGLLLRKRAGSFVDKLRAIWQQEESLMEENHDD